MKIYSTGFYDADGDDRRGTTTCHEEWHLDQDVVRRKVDDLNDKLLHGAINRWRQAHEKWEAERDDWNALVAAGRRVGEFTRHEPIKPTLDNRRASHYEVIEDEVDTDGFMVTLVRKFDSA